ncbi:MAG: putative cytosolic protein [uncultured bacterium]|nr:MAG: putative cytosolic protein [uncultured bacterium]OGT25625.1 MAG: hypothetical protein A3B71_06240 [Gammaproteobacteria bacterium RIFCSPHIGHO2_02_FULL_42_43]OGT51580.1 MAG: hypothetical protein A3E54_06005 [Gammaproteobacteria bacterium RIFCSPHIGHO2_12_FULL_41_25]
MPNTPSHNPFTQFFNTLLANSTLKSSLYHLQHESGFNLNIALYLIWFAQSSFGRLSRRQIKMLQAQIVLWHQRVIAELKYTHALIANHADPIAIQIREALEVEIAKAYQIEQQMLYESQSNVKTLKRKKIQQLNDACVSIVHYCELKNDLLIDEDEAAFFKIICAVFHDMDHDDIQKQLMRAFAQLRHPSNRPMQMTWEEF